VFRDRARRLPARRASRRYWTKDLGGSGNVPSVTPASPRTAKSRRQRPKQGGAISTEVRTAAGQQPAPAERQQPARQTCGFSALGAASSDTIFALAVLRVETTLTVRSMAAACLSATVFGVWTRDWFCLPNSWEWPGWAWASGGATKTAAATKATAIKRRLRRSSARTLGLIPKGGQQPWRHIA